MRMEEELEQKRRDLETTTSNLSLLKNFFDAAPVLLGVVEVKQWEAISNIIRLTHPSTLPPLYVCRLMKMMKTSGIFGSMILSPGSSTDRNLTLLAEVKTSFDVLDCRFELKLVIC
jgi:hypothetical protein